MKIYSKVVDGSLTEPMIKEGKGVFITSYSVSAHPEKFYEMSVSISSDTYVGHEDLPEGLIHIKARYDSDGYYADLLLEFPHHEDLIGRLGYVGSGCQSKVVSSVEEI